MDLLEWLQDWCARNYPEDDVALDHSDGVRIEQLDNPGWALRVDLRETSCAGRTLERVTIDRSARDWLHLRVENDRFEAFGGPFNLTELLARFRDWAESPKA